MTKDFDEEFNKEFNKQFKNRIDDNIEEPNYLKDIFDSSIKKSKRKLLIKNTIKTSKVVISIFIVFIISINLFPSLSAIASNLPIIGRLAEILTIDKGLNNAVKEGLYQEINFKETKNGITLKVTNVAGDYRSLRLEYLLEGIEKNDVRMKIRDKNNNHIPHVPYKFSKSKDGSEDLNSSYEIGFEEFFKEFTVTFDVYESTESEVSLAEFKVDINLDDKFNVEDAEIEIKNNIIKTEIGDIVIKKMTSTKTRTNLEFDFVSEEYDFMEFDNLRLVDEKGNEYNSTNGGSIDNENNNFNLRIESDLSKKKELTLKSDGIYYARKDDRDLVLDLENLEISKNNYNIEVAKDISENDYSSRHEDLKENQIILRAKGVLGFQIESNEKLKHIETGINLHLNPDLSYEENKEKSESDMIIEILTEEKLVDIYITNIKKDRTEALEFKIK